MASPDPGLTPFLIFVGSGRSGTTLFRNIFDAHPDLAMTHEAHFIAPMAQHRQRYELRPGVDIDRFVADLYANPNFRRQQIPSPDLRTALAAAKPADFAAAVRTVFATYATSHGKSRYGDKTPGYVNHLGLLGDVFPEARFVHIIRDGRDVAMAYLDRDEWGPSTLAETALYWRSRVGRGRKAGAALGPECYREVRYEDMVDDPEGTTRSLCDFAGIDFRAEMLDYHERGAAFIASSATPEAFSGLAKPITRGMRDWRTQMAPDAVAFFEAIAGELLTDLGYERATTSSTMKVRAKVVAGQVAWQGKRVAAKVTPLMRRIRRKSLRTPVS